MRKILLILILILLSLAGYGGYQFFSQYRQENEVLKKIVARLEADSRVAEVLVTDVQHNPKTQKTDTTIKFLEYDSEGLPLKPRYFTFSGNIIQFQSLVIRFEDIHVRRQDAFKGRSAYLFWKVFLLDGKNTEEYDLAQKGAIPQAYKLKDEVNSFEESLWKDFWGYVLSPTKAKKKGIKNAQIEAPGTLFVPGVLYTIKIEHDGGLRIDASVLSPILQGEKIL